MNNYIYWNYKPCILCNADDIINKVEFFKRVDAGVPASKTRYADWFNGNKYNYRVDENGQWTTLYVAEKEEFGYRTYRMKCHYYKNADDIINRPISPSECRAEMIHLFKQYNNVSLCRAFKPVPSILFQNLVPKTIYYIDRKCAAREIPNVKYIDVSSMFPANARGRLPDAHTAVTRKGRVKPSAEYPFAFYIISHHCAEYGVFDTHDYFKLPMKYYAWQCYAVKHNKNIPIYADISDDEDITILMKPSKYEFTETMEEIYRRKLDGDALAKMIANVGIGTLHRNPQSFGKDKLNDYYHLAAIIIGRSNAVQYNMMKKIELSGGHVLQAIVDSIIYADGGEFGDKVKSLGKYYDEYGRVFYRSTSTVNRYVIYDGDRNILKYVLSGVKKNEQVLEKPEDIDNYMSIENDWEIKS